MESIREALTESLGSFTTQRPSSDAARLLKEALERAQTEHDASPEERWDMTLRRMQEKVERHNRTPGTLDADDGYDCPLCLNRGEIMSIRDTGTMIYEVATPCACMNIRRSIWRLKASGLEASIRRCTFKTFEANEPWQQKMVEAAKRYLAEGVKDGRWLYMGGQPGCGKTHICTAVARELLYKMPLLYVVWPDVSKKLGALRFDADEYADEISKIQRVEALYIDDFFKPVIDGYRRGVAQKLPPTAADMKLAFEILNYRYINRLPTILSSEWHLAELGDMDEATASRIAERCGEFAMAIGRDRKRNRRFSGGAVI